MCAPNVVFNAYFLKTRVLYREILGTTTAATRHNVQHKQQPYSSDQPWLEKDLTALRSRFRGKAAGTARLADATRSLLGYSVGCLTSPLAQCWAQCLTASRYGYLQQPEKHTNAKRQKTSANINRRHRNTNYCRHKKLYSTRQHRMQVIRMLQPMCVQSAQQGARERILLKA